MIEATMRNRLSIITYVADGYYNKAFIVFLVNNKDKIVSVVKYWITNLIPK